MDEEKENKKDKKKTIRKALIAIAFLSTYIMVFLLGRITNRWTLGDRDSTKTDANVTETPSSQTPSSPGIKKPIISPNMQGGSNIITRPINEPLTPEEEEKIDGIINVYEKNGENLKNWNILKNLTIFESYFYDREYHDMVAPGFFGTYEFVIENKYSRPIDYILSFKEENVDKINMVYKVLNEDNYILGNDTQNVYLDGVKLQKVTLPANSRTLYKLYWKWEDTDYDTELGINATATYRIFIDVYAELAN